MSRDVELSEAGIEAAARAMFDYHHRGSGDFDPSFAWTDLDESARAYWRELAGAARAAVSAPEDAIVKAGREQSHLDTRSAPEDEHETSDAVRGDLHGTPVEWPERQPTDPDRGQLRDAATPASGRGRQSGSAPEDEREPIKVRPDVERIILDDGREFVLASEAREQTAREIAEWLRHIDRLDEIPGADEGLPDRNPLWDAANAILKHLAGPQAPEDER